MLETREFSIKVSGQVSSSFEFSSTICLEFASYV